MNKSKSKPKQIQIPKCKQKNKKSIILNIKIGKKNNENSISMKKNNENLRMCKKSSNFAPLFVRMCVMCIYAHNK